MTNSRLFMSNDDFFDNKDLDTKTSQPHFQFRTPNSKFIRPKPVRLSSLNLTTINDRFDNLVCQSPLPIVFYILTYQSARNYIKEHKENKHVDPTKITQDTATLNNKISTTSTSYYNINIPPQLNKERIKDKVDFQQTFPNKLGHELVTPKKVDANLQNEKPERDSIKNKKKIKEETQVKVYSNEIKASKEGNIIKNWHFMIRDGKVI